MAAIISPTRVLVAARAQDKWDAIGQLVELFVDSGDLAREDRSAALDAVCRREQQSSTGLGPGLAIPHAEYDGMCCEIGALGIFRDGVDFQGLGGLPSHFVLMLLYPAAERDGHIHNLASAVRALSAPGVGDQLRASTHPDEACAHLENGGLVRRDEPHDAPRSG